MDVSERASVHPYGKEKGGQFSKLLPFKDSISCCFKPPFSKQNTCIPNKIQNSLRNPMLSQIWKQSLQRKIILNVDQANSPDSLAYVSLH